LLIYLFKIAALIYSELSVKAIKLILNLEPADNHDKSVQEDRNQLSAISYQLSAISYQLSAISYKILKFL